MIIILFCPTAIVKPIEHACHQKSPPLGDDRAERHAPTVILQTKTSTREATMFTILRQRHHHRDTGVLHTDKPARESIESEHGRRSSDTDSNICGPVPRHPLRDIAHSPQPIIHLCRIKNRVLSLRRCPENEPEASALLQSLSCPKPVSHSAGSHSQKSEEPVDDIEEHRSHGNGSDISRNYQYASTLYIHQTQKRYRDIGY